MTDLCKTCTGHEEYCHEKECAYLFGRLGYNPDTGRFGLLVWDLWEIDGIGLGQPMEVRIDGTWKKTRMEMDFKRMTPNKKRGLWCLSGTYFRENNIDPFDLEGASVRFHL